jgi:spore coat protein U-like protein
MMMSAVSKTTLGIQVGALALLTAIAPTTAMAATATANLSATATVINNCTISTATLAFGNYDPVDVNAAAHLDASGTVTIACTKGATATIGLGLGANASGSTRRLTDGSGNYLTYEMYHEAARTTVWGTTGAALLSPAAAPSKAARNFTVYGRVASNQDATAGSYTDTIVATVNF